MHNSLISMLGFQMSTAVLVITILGCLLVGAVVGIFVFRAIVIKKINNAKNSASSIIEDAHLEAKTILKEARLSAQEESIKIKTDTENELKERRIEMEKMNNRFLQREEFINNREQSLDKKNEALESFKEKLENQEKKLTQQQEELSKKNAEVVVELQKVAGLTKEEAKEKLIAEITEEAKHDAVIKLRKIEQETKDNAHKIATEIISNAIQKYSADLTSETTVTTVALPNDDMKGRLIGREGRNIKALEMATGIDLIIDDTPEAIVLSGFDPIRREVARIAITKLIQDGRIQPARIEEIVAKTKRGGSVCLIHKNQEIYCLSLVIATDRRSK